MMLVVITFLFHFEYYYYNSDIKNNLVSYNKVGLYFI